MKKLISLFIISSLLLFGGMVSAATPELPNAEIAGGYGGDTGIKPYTKIMRVRYGGHGAVGTGIASGDPVAWDAASSDGITVTKMNGAWDRSASFAGIAVTPILTWDAGATTVKATDKNWGYIALQGYCIASIDSAATAGSTLSAASATGGLITNQNTAESQDVGVLLQTVASAGKHPVWLR
jgi:hypothetical protein